MANTNPQAIKLLNERLRPFCDRIGQVHFTTNVLSELFTVLNAKELYPPNGEEVEDGAQQDGRPIVTNDMAFELVTTGIKQLSDFFENNPQFLSLILKIAVNPERL